ncbi:MAG: ABC transporter permease [Myxococcales bacterium]|nr:ABC transporter permease [Myxococcales bacterium]
MWLTYLQIALRVLRANLFRSTLTVASIVIGAFSIVLMTSLAESGFGTLSRSFEELGGARLISMWPAKPEHAEGKEAMHLGGIDRHDAEAVRKVPHLVSLTQFVSSWRQDLQSDSGTRLQGDLVGGDAAFLTFFRYQLAEGRGLDEDDIVGRTRSCVIGHELANKLWGEGSKVIGRNITVAGTHCKVVGRLQKVDRWGLGFGWKWDELLLLPIDTLLDRMPQLGKLGRRMFLLTDNPKHNDIVKRIVNALLMERHHGIDDFRLFDFETRLKGFFQVFLIMKVIVGLLASISLVVGGVGIMNIMLVSVSERVREIGIRKALGATPSDIGRQFLVEATLLSGVGGAMGAGMGVLGALLGGAIISHFKPTWLTLISRPAVLIALSSSGLIGLLFGYWPARSASRLDPVVAIRSQ